MFKPITFLALLFSALLVTAQEPPYNPNVSNPSISPTPMPSAASAGTALLSFTVGNTGTDTLNSLSGHKMTLEIELSRGVPGTSDPLQSLGGTYNDYFTWEFRDSKFIGTQSKAMLPAASGSITVVYKATSNSTQQNPQNGFKTIIKPGPYSTNLPQDDDISLYTWTECTKPAAPVPQNEVQPTCSLATGSVELTNLPSTGNWTLTRTPGNVTISGTGTTRVITGLAPETYTFTVTNSEGCTSDPSADIIIKSPPAAPSAPKINTTNQPDCNVATGSVLLTGLPDGSWVLTVSPGGRTISGSTTSITVDKLLPGTYTFKVMSNDCISDASSPVTIEDQPGTAQSPEVGTTTQPNCVTSTGSVILNRLPATGTWTLTMQPEGIEKTGTGTSTTITNLSPGSYSFTVTPQTGCTSAPTNVTIDPVPSPPAAPRPGNPVQPTCSVQTGSVVLSSLPGGSWTLTRNQGGITVTGSSSSYTVSGLNSGTYTFTVTKDGCVSDPSSPVVINAAPEVPSAPVPDAPTQPTCDIATGSVLLTELPSSGNWTLVRNPGGVRIEASGTSYTNTGLTPGTYTYRIINQANCTSDVSSAVVINGSPALSTPVTRLDCRLGSGSAIVTVTSPVGTGIEYRLDNGSYQPGAVFSGVSNGSHVITARNAAGCSAESASFLVSCGCVNGPSVNLSSRSGSACSMSPVTVSGNTFDGSATSVNVTEDGAGTVTPVTINSSPFSFTYTPATGDIGRVVTITFTTNNPVGEPCTPAVTTYSLTVNAVPSAPVIGTVTQPSCTSSNGSVAISGLPAGSWSIVRNPGSVSTSGSGTTTIISGLDRGTYTFTVTNNAGCISSPSSSVTINQQPPIPDRPVAGTIVHPTCTVPMGSVVVNGLPETGTWTLTRFPGTVTSTGTGTSTTVSGLASGTYNFTVTGSEGCSSQPSANVVINAPPPIPSAPVQGNVTAPTCLNPLGQVILSGLPTSGTWTINSIPAGVRLSGTGASATLTGIIPAVYTFTVTSASGCVSPVSSSVVIPPVPNAPALVINNPAALCAPAIVDITAPSITAGSPAGLTYTYWSNQNATVPYTTPSSATNGTYYIKGTNSAQCSDVKAVKVTIRENPVASAGPDQVLEYEFITTISAKALAEGETGLWSVLKGTAFIANPSASSTLVTNLEIGENVFIWKVTNGVCLPSSDSLRIKVLDLVIPTLITPNNDGHNDYFVLNGIEDEKNIELTVFDRRGMIVFTDKHYRNDWNGVDYKGRPLADDTYFFVFKTRGRPRTGFVVIRR